MDRLIEGARQLGLDLTPRQVEQFQLYYRELMNWNKRMNLTAITDYEGVQVKHFLDSLTVILALDKVQSISSRQSCLIDIGTGAGLIFKGNGFYETDYRSKDYQEAQKKEKPDTAEAKDKKDTKADAKTESKSENKTLENKKTGADKKNQA